jgi:hypothetical protein
LHVPGIPPNINRLNMHSSCSFLPVICPLFEGFKYKLKLSCLFPEKIEQDGAVHQPYRE